MTDREPKKVAPKAEWFRWGGPEGACMICGTPTLWSLEFTNSGGGGEGELTICKTVSCKSSLRSLITKARNAEQEKP